MLLSVPGGGGGLDPRTPGGHNVFPLANRGKNRRSLAVSRNLKARFREADKDRNGMLDEEELGELLRAGNPRIKDEEVHAIFALVDRDESGKVDFDEFVDFLFMPGVDGPTSSSASSASSSSASQPPSLHSEDGSEDSDSDDSSLKSEPVSDCSGDTEKLVKAASMARRVSKIFDIDSSAVEEVSADRVKVSGAHHAPSANGKYRKREPDWVVNSSSGLDERAGISVNGMPIYQQEGDENAKGKHKPNVIFYGWTQHWGRWGQAGWFVGPSVPPDQQPVTSFLLFCPWPDAETPDRCRAMWETRKGEREKRMLCEAIQVKGRKVHKRGRGDLIDSELWAPRTAWSVGAGVAADELNFEWRVEPAEESWEEPEAESPDEEEPPKRKSLGRQGSRQKKIEEEAENDQGADLDAEAAAMAAQAKEAERPARSEQGRRPPPKPAQRRMSVDVSLQYMPGFNVVSKVDQRDKFLEKKRLEGGRRNSLAPSAPVLGIRRTQSLRNTDEVEESDTGMGKTRRKKRGDAEDEDDENGDFPGLDKAQSRKLKALVGKGSSIKVDGWERLPLLHQKSKLFTHILPEDVLCDAAASNRWFLWACAAVAEYPAWIHSIFGRVPRLAPDGRYRIRLYHPGKQSFVHISLDDNVPTRGGGPAFAGIACEGDIWVALLEKAFAKFCGSYAQTDDGPLAFGLLYLCGGGAERWQRQGDKVWQRYSAEWKGSQDGQQVERKGAEVLQPQQGSYGPEELWEVMHRCRMLCRPVLCSVDRKACKKGCGLIANHPYSLLVACEVPSGSEAAVLRMVRLRDPFRATEDWSGRWGRNSTTFMQNPAVAAHLQDIAGEDDGGFWMSYSDFLTHFDGVDFAIKSMPLQGCCQAIKKEGDARLGPKRRRSSAKGRRNSDASSTGRRGSG